MQTDPTDPSDLLDAPMPVLEEPAERAPLTRVDHVLLALETILVTSALAGGIPAIIDPTGNLHGLGVEILEGTAFSDFRLPGIALVMLLGLVPFVAIGGTLLRKPWVRAAHVEVGIILIAWTLIQVAMVGWFTWVQPLALLLGGAIIVLGVRNPST